MEQEAQHPGSHLFTVRVWQEELGDGKAEWRGRAQNIATGAGAYFRGWPGLIAVLSRLVETSTALADDSSGENSPGPRLQTQRPPHGEER